MGLRRESRKCAIHVLYTMDISGLGKEDVGESFWSSQVYNKKIATFANELIDGTAANMDEINKKLKETTKNWELDRMTSVDRAILRLATYELLFMPQTPPNVIINEAIELAKEFSTENSGKFVNGILDQIKNIRTVK